jgi:type IV secretion system protein VirB9
MPKPENLLGETDMKFYVPLAALMMTLPVTVNAVAEQKPVTVSSDSRIKKFNYDENNVYKLDVYLKAITTIEFSEGEQVQSILVGDSASWEIVRLKSGNVISVKPITPSALTNMTVYTDRYVYTFELRSVGTIQPSRESAASQTYRSQFVYPEDKRTAGFSTAPNNYDYFSAGQSKFNPTSVYDNGKQTFFVFPENAPKPAIFKSGQKGSEALVNMRTKGNMVVVDAVNDYWTVRIGDEYICVAAGAAVKDAEGDF